MQINVDPESVLRPVPALRGVHLGDSHDPFIEEDVARFKEEVGVTGMRIGMMPGGGYVVAPTHQVQDNTPTENVLAMFRAAREYGTYRKP